MARYGSVHRIGDFIARMLPARGSGAYEGLFVHRGIKFLEVIDAAQESNPALTLAIHTGDALFLTYEGRRICYIIPTQKYLRVGVLVGSGNVAKSLGQVLKDAETSTTGVHPLGPGGGGAAQWRIAASALDVFEQFIKALPMAKSNSLDIKAHPRQFPGAVRQAALEQFDVNGRICAGVAARGIKPHKLGKLDRIEFDHILPYKRGGSTSALNIQVLCTTCNSAKRATAL